MGIRWEEIYVMHVLEELNEFWKINGRFPNSCIISLLDFDMKTSLAVTAVIGTCNDIANEADIRLKLPNFTNAQQTNVYLHFIVCNKTCNYSIDSSKTIIIFVDRMRPGATTIRRRYGVGAAAAYRNGNAIIPCTAPRESILNRI